MLAAEPKAVGAVLADPSLTAGAPAWKAIVAPVEPFLQAVSEHLAAQVDEFEPEVAAHARYALTNQGKQLRPALVALSGEATGGINDDLVTVAAIIEMIHLATLVHDDVVDEAEIRRRRPTLAAQAGNTTSVLVGDCLFAHALKLAAGFPTTEVCRAVSAATKTVCSGEIIQSQRQHQLRTSRAEYFRVLRMKTAELFSLSCELGARLSDASEVERIALRDYGLALGTAYQIYDDCLDVFGTEARAGKSLRTDLVSGKPTLPVIVAWEKATQDERRFLEGMVAAWKPKFMKPLVSLLERTDALTESRAVIRGFCATARVALQRLDQNNGCGRLIAVAEYIGHQTDDLGV